MPGLIVRELPVKLTSQNNVEHAPDGRLFAAGYNGPFHLLRDTDGSYWVAGAERRAFHYAADGQLLEVDPPAEPMSALPPLRERTPAATAPADGAAPSNAPAE